MHFAVGRSGGGATDFADAVVAAFLDAVVFLGIIGGGETTDPAPHHNLTPPCPAHAPCKVFAVEKVLSVHWQVAPFGVFAGFWANAGTASMPALATTHVENSRRARPIIATSTSEPV